MEIRRLARACALEAILKQRDDFRRWGVMADWEWGDDEIGAEAIMRAADKQSIYVTMSPTMRLHSWRSFGIWSSLGLCIVD